MPGIGARLSLFLASGCYIGLALLYLVALLLMVSLNRRVDLPAAGSAESIAASLLAGLREARSQPVIRAVLLITMLIGAWLLICMLNDLYFFLSARRNLLENFRLAATQRFDSLCRAA